VTDLLRKLAAELREEDARRQATKREKCAQVLVAATGLSLLQQKLKGASNGPH
jgi:hypothetical protein